MVRVVLIVLLLTAAALAVSLYVDHRRRRESRLDPLRSAFLHGRPLAAQGGAVDLAPMAHPGGVSFRVPASWTVEMRGEGHTTVAGPGGHRRIEVHTERRAGASGPEALAQALQAGLSGERTVEPLPGGHMLVKSCTAAAGESGPLVRYEWRLGRPAPEGGLEMAVFVLRAPLDRAGDVITRSDLATLDREVRAARFERDVGSGAGSGAAS